MDIRLRKVGRKRRLNCSSKVNTWTNRWTNRRTFWLIESIGPEGRCFKNLLWKNVTLAKQNWITNLKFWQNHKFWQNWAFFFYLLQKTIFNLNKNSIVRKHKLWLNLTLNLTLIVTKLNMWQNSKCDKNVNKTQTVTRHILWQN